MWTVPEVTPAFGGAAGTNAGLISDASIAKISGAWKGT